MVPVPAPPPLTSTVPLSTFKVPVLLKDTLIVVVPVVGLLKQTRVVEILVAVGVGNGLVILHVENRLWVAKTSSAPKSLICSDLRPSCHPLFLVPWPGPTPREQQFARHMCYSYIFSRIRLNRAIPVLTCFNH